MAISFGEMRILKEFKIKISKTGEVKGYLDLVWRGKIRLMGVLDELNDKKANLVENLPLKLHFKIKKPLNENDQVFQDKRTETPKQVLKYFKENQKIGKIQIYVMNNFLHITAYGEPYGKWRAGARLKNIEILEEENVPEA